MLLPQSSAIAVDAAPCCSLQHIQGPLSVTKYQEFMRSRYDVGSHSEEHRPQSARRLLMLNALLWRTSTCFDIENMYYMYTMQTKLEVRNDTKRTLTGLGPEVHWHRIERTVTVSPHDTATPLKYCYNHNEAGPSYSVLLSCFFLFGNGSPNSKKVVVEMFIPFPHSIVMNVQKALHCLGNV